MKRKLLWPLLLLAVTILSACERKSEPPTAAPPDATKSDAPALLPQATAQKLQGQWLRTDSDYLLQIKSVGEDGKVEAAYLNPQPIKVSKAEAKMDGNTVKLFVELRDTGYPGCTYTLAYDMQSDQLFGVYYQAALQQSFQIVFGRLK